MSMREVDQTSGRRTGCLGERLDKGSLVNFAQRGSGIEVPRMPQKIKEGAR